MERGRECNGTMGGVQARMPPVTPGDGSSWKLLQGGRDLRATMPTRRRHLERFGEIRAGARPVAVLAPHPSPPEERVRILRIPLQGRPEILERPVAVPLQQP